MEHFAPELYFKYWMIPWKEAVIIVRIALNWMVHELLGLQNNLGPLLSLLCSIPVPIVNGPSNQVSLCASETGQRRKMPNDVLLSSSARQLAHDHLSKWGGSKARWLRAWVLESDPPSSHPNPSSPLSESSLVKLLNVFQTKLSHL